MATFERQEGQEFNGVDPDTKDRDLEQYGVWVKAEPQDVFEEAEGEMLSPFSEETEDLSLSDESFLSKEDKDLLGAVEDSSGSEDESLGKTDEIPSIPDISDFESMEDLGVPIEEFTPIESSETAKSSKSETDFVDVSDFDLEEPEPVLETGVSSEFEPIDIDLKFDDTLPPRPAAQGASVSKSAPPAEDGFETVTDFDDFLNSPEVQMEPESESSVLDSSGTEEAATLGSEEFSLDDIPDISSPSTIDDVAELEKDLSSFVEPGVAPSDESVGPKSEVSSEILLKIAGELSSIKAELVSLKSQIAAIKAESEEFHKETVEETETAGSGKAGGFFDEEEDETIALTGDELDNILNTAEFSEESAEAEASSNLEEDSPEAPEDLLPESGDYGSAPEEALENEEPAIEELSLSSEEPTADLPESIDDSVLSTLGNEGVAPLTPPPEDTSYLEEQPEADEADMLAMESEGGIPEAPLLEPNPEELEIEDLVEDTLEDAEELPLAETESPTDLEEPEVLIEEPEDLEELTLDIEGDASNIVLETPEHVEMPIPELEEESIESEESFPEFVEEIPTEDESDNLGEIPLHNEESFADESKLVEAAEEPVDIAELEEIDLSEPEEIPSQPEEAEPEELLVEGSEPESPATPEPIAEPETPANPEPIPNRIKDEVRSVLSYLDKLLESLPEEKIEEFAKSEHFETYKRLFEELGLV